MENKYYEVRIFLASYIENLQFVIADVLETAIIQDSPNTLILATDDVGIIKNEIQNIIKLFANEIGSEIKHSITIKEKEQKDWIDEYKKSTKPIIVGNFFIRPEWILKNDNLINIIINPSLVFGTGDHFTTKFCIEFIAKFVRKNDTLLDVGCGSGILGIIASKIGAKVDLCDTDELAIISTKENYKLNNEKYHSIWVGSADKNSNEFDVVVVNIVADVIISMKEDLKNRLKNGGVLILSGILNKYEDKILSNFAQFELLDKKQNSEWVSFVFKKKRE